MRNQYSLKNLDCANCASIIENHFRNISGLQDTSVNFSTTTLHINSSDIGFIRKEVAKVEPQIEILPLSETKEKVSISDSRNIFRIHYRQIVMIIISTLFLLFLLLFEKQLHKYLFNKGDLLVAIIAFAICGWGVLVKAAKTIFHKQWMDENVLMSLASIGALAIHAFEEAVGVMIFYQLGELLQNMAVNRSRTSIHRLMEIRPDYANLKMESGITKVPPSSVNVDDIILVKAGEKIPLDSTVIDGVSEVNTAVLTGESLPKSVKIDDSVLAGEINLTGILTLKVSKIYSESSVSKILDLVENASEKKTKTENFVTAFARYYTPAIVLFSLLISVVPPLVIPDQTFTNWIYRALVLLVISCPCALIISIPLGYFGGIGGASKRGILIKGTNYIDALANIKSVVFDKTGTLTSGSFSIRKIIAADIYSESDILRFAALAESHSNHPIAKSITTAFSDRYGSLDQSLITEHQEISGYGVKAIIDGHNILAGNDALMKREHIYNSHYECDETIIYIAVDCVLSGYIIIGDQIKNDSLNAIRQLHEMGIEDIAILTGDNKNAALFTGNYLKINKIYAALLPEHKVEVFEEIEKNKSHKGSIAFVGDGINDAPVLARADVGIAMGALGSDAAIETADVVLMTDHPSKVAEAIAIGRKTRSIVIQNIIMALSIKVAFVILGCFGIASMWEAVFADMGVAILAVLNSSRALNVNV